MNLTMLPATSRDAFAIHLRDSDFEEAKQWAPGVGAHRALGISIKNSEKAYTVFQGDEVVCIMGFSMNDREVHPWLMCSDYVNNYKKRFLRGAKAYVHNLRVAYPDHLVCNHVYRTNEQAKRLLKALGFRVVPSPGDSKFDFFYLP